MIHGRREAEDADLVPLIPKLHGTSKNDLHPLKITRRNCYLQGRVSFHLFQEGIRNVTDNMRPSLTTEI